MRISIFTIACLWNVVALAAAPVIDITDMNARLQRLERVMNAKNDLELFSRIQTLEEEVRQLRGLTEEQAYLIDKLKQRQRQLYADIDARLQKQTKPTVTTPPPVSAVMPPNPKNAHVQPTLPGQRQDIETSEKLAYENAFRYVKEKRFDVAKAAFETFLSVYPESQYVPNAHYWVGELNYAKKNLNGAKDAFSLVVEKFPTHQKAADALVKLGFVHYDEGDIDKSKALFNQVKARYPASSASRLAESRLIDIKRKGVN